jgi:hypothetical protein
MRYIITACDNPCSYNKDTELSYAVLDPTVGLGLGVGLLGQAAAARDISRNQPFANSVDDASLNALLDAADARMSNNPVKGADLKPNVPQGTAIERFANTMRGTPQGGKSSASRMDIPGEYTVNYNPNADKAFLAHELGHVASDRTRVGGMIRSARTNPMLSGALKQAAMLAPGAAAAFTAGDDDLAQSVGLAYAASLPTILDEMSATRHGLGIMQDAGMRASLGQRGKLAGGLLSYLGAPLLAGMGGNIIGNLMDDELVGPPQTSGTVMPA